jgi:lysophospholipase L1-like esterase
VLRWLAPMAVLLSACTCGVRGFVAADDARVERVGRFVISERGALRFAWPATQLRLRFRGTALRAELEDAPLQDETPDNDWLALELDGQPARKLRLARGRRSYQLARELPAGVHTLVLTKRTEAEVGTVTLHGLFEDGAARLLAAPARRRRRIEVIGDSISAGYGDEGTEPGCGFRASEEDASRSYAAVAARALGAELIVQAWSGKGVYRNHDARDAEVMPEIFTRVLPARRTSPRSDASFRPHVLVVHLGTNDFWAGPPDAQRFLAAYRQLLAALRARSPGAKQLLVLSPMLSDEYPHPGARPQLRAWLRTLRDEAVAEGHDVSLLEQQYQPGEALGCHAHPSLLSHARFGAELAAALRRALGW